LIDQNKYDLLLKAFNRERKSRKEAERIIEQKALELYYANVQLSEVNKNLENKILERTKDIEKSKEELLIAKKIAENATKAKSEFLSNMTHELRTPLNGVIGLAEIVLNEKLSKNVKEMLENIKFSANHLGHVINEILDFSKIEAGKITFENIEFNLPELVNSTYNNLSISSQKNKTVDVILNYDENIPKIVVGDPVKLNQILNNLIGNAVKFTSKGYIKLSCKLVNLDKSSDKVILSFSVSDTGIGIKKESIDGIFKSFNQSDSSVSRKYGGTGLGLTITKNFIDLQGGKLTVESEYGMGSTFSFEMPFKFVTEDSFSNVKINPFENRSIDANILVVDDIAINQLVVSKILNKWNARVDIASSGKDALYLLKKKTYDLILMDVQMPGMSGVEATTIIRNDKDYSHIAHIPIIAFTANAFDDSQKHVLDSGMNAFVTKPVRPDKLYEEITKLLPIK